VTPPLGSPRFVAAAASILLWCAAGAFLAVWFSGRIRDWSVMTDELQYVKLALAVAETGSPLPSLHDTSVSIANQLYPLLLAPVYGSLSSPDAFRAAHVLNAFLMTSAVFPAYLLGRELLTRAWSFAVAVLVVAVPWIVLTGFVMSESPIRRSCGPFWRSSGRSSIRHRGATCSRWSPSASRSWRGRSSWRSRSSFRSQSSSTSSGRNSPWTERPVFAGGSERAYGRRSDDTGRSGRSTPRAPSS
jgi:hypothetical protein